MSFELFQTDDEIRCEQCGEPADVHVTGYEAQVSHNSDRVTIHGDPLEGDRSVYIHVTERDSK